MQMFLELVLQFNIALKYYTKLNLQEAFSMYIIYLDSLLCTDKMFVEVSCDCLLDLTLVTSI